MGVKTIKSFRKNILFSIIIIFFYQFLFACNSDKDNSTEKIRDMVLIYGGGTHRDISWNKEHFAPYVSLQNEDGTIDWLFDGFLFLELQDGEKRLFTSLSHLKWKSARKQEWKYLIDSYFKKDNAIFALNNQITDVKKKTKSNFTKRKIVIGVPEPIINQTDWGEIDGKLMDFSKHKDRLQACEWFIDYAIENFKKANLKNLELTGFYWTAEEATTSRDLVPEVIDYVNELGYKMYWIPYFNADGFNEWAELGFDKAYYQPNYFFREERPVSQIERACRDALKYGMSMEMEFDDRALAKNGWAYRMKDYIEVFDQYKVWDKMDVAYYQEVDTFYKLFHSDNDEDNELYLYLAKIIAKRQKYN